MQYKPCNYVSLIVALFLMIPYVATASDKEMYWRLKASDVNLSSEERLGVIDSLISRCPAMSDSLLFLSADIAYQSGLYSRSLVALERLDSKKYEKNEISISKRCRLLLMLAKTRIKCNDKAEGIDDLMRLIHLDKPDSLSYYDVDGICMLNDVYSAYRVNEGNGYIPSHETLMSRAEQIYEKARKNGVSGYPLNEMSKTLLFFQNVVCN